MKSKFKFSFLTLELVFGTFIFGAIMCLINSFVSYREFRKELEIMYSNITEQIARTGASYIHADKIPYWLENGRDFEWEITNEKLDALTNTCELAYIYVTTVSPDYKSRTYIFDTVNKQVKNSYFYPFGKVSSLEHKDQSYIDNLKVVLEEGQKQSWFVYKKGESGHVTTAVPLYNSQGKTCAIIGIVKPMTEVKEYNKSFLTSVLIYAISFAVIFLVFYTIILYFRIIRPILFITDETSHFAEHQGELTGILKKINNKDEIGTLAKSVEKMSSDMNKYIRDLTYTTAEKERLSTELNVATQIQADMLPKVFPPFKNHPEIELFASMEPAKEVGGDFYDFYMVDDDHFAVVVGDVSGKGVPAALFMVITKTLLKDTAMHSTNPAQIFTSVNSVLCEGNDFGLFVTCWMGIITLSTGELNFANAGHLPPIIFHNKELKYLKTKANLMLAGMEGIKYTNHTINLDAGDRIFLYTDGITEAMNSEMQLYGEERLINIMKSVENLSSRQILSIVKDDINAFVKSAQQFDDITMLEMSFKMKNTREQK
ncbi:MAG: SpoIIE family protein phosphatase [Treponema sp.]|nr:SpoIIE family protein phosphatase [Treponema sp.]